jgi:hypothetical protein
LKMNLTKKTVQDLLWKLSILNRKSKLTKNDTKLIAHIEKNLGNRGVRV